MLLMTRVQTVLNVPSHSLMNDDDVDGGYVNQYCDEDYADSHAAYDQGNIASVYDLAYAFLCYTMLLGLYALL